MVTCSFESGYQARGKIVLSKGWNSLPLHPRYTRHSLPGYSPTGRHTSFFLLCLLGTVEGCTVHCEMLNTVPRLAYVFPS